MAGQGGERSGEHVGEQNGCDEILGGEIEVELASGEEACAEEEPEGACSVGAEATVFQDFDAAFGGVPPEERVCRIRDRVFVECAGEEKGEENRCERSEVREVRVVEQEGAGHGEPGENAYPGKPRLGTSRDIFGKGRVGGDGDPGEELEGGEQRGHGEP